MELNWRGRLRSCISKGSEHLREVKHFNHIFLDSAPKFVEFPEFLLFFCILVYLNYMQRVEHCPCKTNNHQLPQHLFYLFWIFIEFYFRAFGDLLCPEWTPDQIPPGNSQFLNFSRNYPIFPPALKIPGHCSAMKILNLSFLSLNLSFPEVRLCLYALIIFFFQIHYLSYIKNF